TVNAEPTARAVQSFLDTENGVELNLIGDGLLPPDIDGVRRPRPTDAPAPIVGTQDDGGGYGATFDALNIWELTVHWRSTPTASLELVTQLPVASFDSIFPCAPGSRDCLPQPGYHKPRSVSGYSLLPAAANLAAGLPQLRHIRVARDESVGGGPARSSGRTLVRDSADWRQLLDLSAGYLCTQ